jgi:hypothetical protein
MLVQTLPSEALPFILPTFPRYVVPDGLTSGFISKIPPSLSMKSLLTFHFLSTPPASKVGVKTKVLCFIPNFDPFHLSTLCAGV